MRIVGAEFLGSVVGAVKGRKGAQPEFSVIGRSNVGKSSLINRLAGQKIARTSSTPGATQLINRYRMEYEHEGGRGTFILSDFPGFGYSKVSKSTYGAWEGMAEGYLRSSADTLVRLLWVFDVRRDFDDLDLAVIAWAEDRGLPMTLILTKIDKEARTFGVRRMKQFQGVIPHVPVLIFSAKEGVGKQELLTHLLEAIEDAGPRPVIRSQ
jgi:GTP-binding protein